MTESNAPATEATAADQPAPDARRVRLVSLVAAGLDPFRTAESGGFPSVSGEVAPASIRDVTPYFKRRKDAAAKSAEAEAQARADFYAARVRSWDVADAAGDPVPVTAAAMLALPYPVWVQMEDIVLGFAGAVDG